MTYIPSLDQKKLNQLADQYLSSNPVTGDVIFFPEAEARLSHATWLFSDEDEEQLRESGFRSALIDLLDELIINRADRHPANSLHGVVNIDNGRLNIQWLSLAEVQSLRERFEQDED